MWVTIRVALVSTAAALVIGLPIGLASGSAASAAAARCRSSPTRASRCRRWSSGSSCCCSCFRRAAFGSLRIEFTLRGGLHRADDARAALHRRADARRRSRRLPPGLLDQARALGAGRVQLSRARAARGEDRRAGGGDRGARRRRSRRSAPSIIVGGNIEGHDQTLASALLEQFNDTRNDPYAIAIGLVLLALILVLIGGADRDPAAHGRHPAALPDGAEMSCIWESCDAPCR